MPFSGNTRHASAAEDRNARYKLAVSSKLCHLRLAKPLLVARAVAFARVARETWLPWARKFLTMPLKDPVAPSTTHA